LKPKKGRLKNIFQTAFRFTGQPPYPDARDALLNPPTRRFEFGK